MKKICPVCKGKGKVFNPMADGILFVWIALLIHPYEECVVCGGTGVIDEE